MSQYKVKKEYLGKGSKTTFSKPVPQVGYHLELDKATPEQLEQFGLTLESIYEEGNPQYARAKTKPTSATTKPDDFDPFEGMYQ